MSGKATSKLLNVNANISLLFVASIIPDIDFLIPGLEHRGPTHSLIIISLLFLPAFIVYRKRAAPYFIAAIQHVIPGDYLTGGVQLLWPATISYGVEIKITSLTNIFLEWAFFLTSLTIMLKTKDAWTLLQHRQSNLLLSIPIFALLLPTFFSFPLPVSLELFLPHLTYLSIFTSSVLIDLKSSMK